MEKKSQPVIYAGFEEDSGYITQEGNPDDDDIEAPQDEDEEVPLKRKGYVRPPSKVTLADGTNPAKKAAEIQSEQEEEEQEPDEEEIDEAVSQMMYNLGLQSGAEEDQESSLPSKAQIRGETAREIGRAES